MKKTVVALLVLATAPCAAQINICGANEFRDTPCPVSTQVLKGSKQASDTKKKEEETPDDVMDQISTALRNKYPHDYQTREKLINQQIQDYEFLVHYQRKDIPANIFKQLRTESEKRYKYDFSMQRQWIENQVGDYLLTKK